MSALKRKVETAFKAVIGTLAGVPSYATHDANFAPVTLPAVFRACEGEEIPQNDRVIVECVGGPEEPRGTGNRLMQVRVTVESGADKADFDTDEADDADDRHANNCGAVFEGLTALGMETLQAQLSAATADFYVFEEGVTELGEDPDIEGRNWREARIYQVYCCGRAMS